MTQEQGKHTCQCGCEGEIRITRNHASNGIPRFINGHRDRIHPLKPGRQPGDNKKEWVAEQQGKHWCQCGCGQLIEIVDHHYNNGVPRFIHGHQARVRLYPADEERFWLKVDRANKKSCWEWAASKSNQGYGHIRSKNPVVKGLAHRLSYFIHYGNFDAKCDVLHKCDNPSCVNPHHLFLGSHQDNMKDAAKKERFKSKLTAESAREIVRLVESGVRQYLVAKQFGITQSTLWSILKGRTWSHATGIKTE